MIRPASLDSMAKDAMTELGNDSRAERSSAAFPPVARTPQLSCTMSTRLPRRSKRITAFVPV